MLSLHCAVFVYALFVFVSDVLFLSSSAIVSVDVLLCSHIALTMPQEFVKEASRQLRDVDRSVAAAETACVSLLQFFADEHNSAEDLLKLLTNFLRALSVRSHCLSPLLCFQKIVSCAVLLLCTCDLCTGFLFVCVTLQRAVQDLPGSGLLHPAITAALLSS